MTKPEITILGRAVQQYKPSECQIAKAFMQYVHAKHPHLANLLIHIPNEGKRSWREGKSQKAQGLRKGVFDYFFAMPAMPGFHICHGLWLELKTHKGKLSKDQVKFQNDMMQSGYLACVAYNLDEAISIFEEYVKS